MSSPSEKRDRDALLIRLPDDVEVLWPRVASTQAQPASGDAPTLAATPGAGILASIAQLAMPHPRPTRFDALDESLEALLGSGRPIAHASGTGSGMALVLSRADQHVVCFLLGDLQGRAGGRSDCRRLN